MIADVIAIRSRRQKCFVEIAQKRQELHSAWVRLANDQDGPRTGPYIDVCNKQLAGFPGKFGARIPSVAIQSSPARCGDGSRDHACPSIRSYSA